MNLSFPTRRSSDLFVEYTREGDILAINHTEVPPEMGGRGIAGKLVQEALRYARDEGLKVLPQCSYADAYMRTHPDDAAVRAQACGEAVLPMGRADGETHHRHQYADDERLASTK